MRHDFNPLVTNIQASPTLALNAQAKALAASGKPVYNLTAGEPDGPTPTYIQNAVKKRLAENKYTPVGGLPELKLAIARHSAQFYRTDWMTERNVVVVPGAKPALFGALFTLLQPGDEVIVPAPYWVSYKQLVELCGAVFVPVKTTNEHDLSVADIAAAMSPRTKLIIVNSPNNPTGAIYSKTALRELAKLVAQKHIYILSDDIYIRLAYEPVPLITTCGFDPTRLLIVNGFSKSQALTGWRIGYLLADETIITAVTNVVSHILGNTSLPAQYGALAALEHGDVPPMRDTLLTRRDLVARQLKTVPKISFVRPDGAFYFLIDIREVTSDSMTWCAELLEKTGVALVPGDDFGASGHARLSFATDEVTLQKSIQLIKRFIEEN